VRGGGPEGTFSTKVEDLLLVHMGSACHVSEISSVSSKLSSFLSQHFICSKEPYVGARDVHCSVSEHPMIMVYTVLCIEYKKESKCIFYLQFFLVVPRAAL
jgi:hypothetical protein